MSVPVHRRGFDVFLSHAHLDAPFVDALNDWLKLAGVEVWYDKERLSAGAQFGTALPAAVKQCRSLLLVATDHALQQGWVKFEANVAIDEMTKSPEFRVIPLRIGKAPVDELIPGVSWIDLQDSKLSTRTAGAILRAFHPTAWLPPATSRDVYISASWQPDDATSANAVCKYLVKGNFRLVGDSKTQDGFRGDRITSIIESCGAAVIVIPFRKAPEASLAIKDYKYFLRELDTSRQLGLPTVVIADPRVKRTDGDDTDWLRMHTDEKTCPGPVASALDALWDDWIEPKQRHFIFYACDLSTECAKSGSELRSLIEVVTGMPTIVGNEIQGPQINEVIMKRLQEAFLVIADLTSKDEYPYNLDVCIEAGMARCAGTSIRLMAAAGSKRSPPFMLGRTDQFNVYRDEVEQLGIVRKLIWPFRRRILNAEFS